MNSEVPMAKTARASRYSGSGRRKEKGSGNGNGIEWLRGEERRGRRLVTAVSTQRVYELSGSGG